MTKLIFFLASTMFLAFVSQETIAQSQTTALQIIAPAPNTIVSPGQTIAVSVRRIAGSDIKYVDLVAFGSSQIIKAADTMVFSTIVPVDAAPGPASVFAVDATLRRPRVVGNTSAPLTVIVASPQIQSLRTSSRAISLEFPGDQTPLRVNGILADARALSLGNSSSLSFESDDTKVATVDKTGLVTAVGHGNANVTAKYSNPNGEFLTTNVRVMVPTLNTGDLNGDGRIDVEDLEVVSAAINTKTSVESDARDLNHDGKIDALDIRLLTTLCTFPRCAAKP